MSKAFWAVIAVIIVVFGSIIIFKDDKAAAPSSTVSASKHVFGEGKSGVKLVEYGDFQCSACYTYEPAVAQVREKYKADITFQYRNLPLLQVHRNAFAAARSAEAASLQNKFWEMHDLLYQNQPAWEGSSNPQQFFEQYASQLKLNMDQYKKDAAGSKVNDVINADIAAFDKTGQVRSTPTFFLNGKKIVFTPDLESFSKEIDAAIAAAAKN